MLWKSQQASLQGDITIPASKSHTIRALVAAALANGTSIIRKPLLKGDGASALKAIGCFGARFSVEDQIVTVEARGPRYSGGQSEIDVQNSGTSLRLFSSLAALSATPRVFDGDNSLRTRPMKGLFTALRSLGATITPLSSSADVPFRIHGPLRGGEAHVDGLTSQFISSLLFATPFAPQKTTLRLDSLNEKPYVGITLWWLDKLGISYRASKDLLHYSVEPNQQIEPIDCVVPADFSSATFAAVAAAITKSVITIHGLDFSDPQGDKEVFDILQRFGVGVVQTNASVRVDGTRPLQGQEVDCNNIPDALPALSVLGCVASGQTRLYNVAQARVKETDRIAVMCTELQKLGARIDELADGLAITASPLRGGAVEGHHDHRVVMALTLAGMCSEQPVIVSTAEAAEVTYPQFDTDFNALGAKISEYKE